MKTIRAIAEITIRGAIRSRVVLALLAVLCVVAGLLPSAIRGDGTMQGYMQVLLSYTLGFVRVILAVTSLWAGCAAISMEVEERQIQMTLTKPVHPVQLWLGKWLGIAVLNAALLAFAGLFIWGHVQWKAHAAELSEADRAILREQLLVSRIPIPPRLPDFDRLFAERWQTMEAGGQTPDSPDMRAPLRQAFEREWIRREFDAGPGETCALAFRLPRRIQVDRPLFLEYRFASSALGSPDLSGLWEVRDGRDRVRHRENVVHKPHRRHVLRIPPGTVEPGGELRAIYTNLSDKDTVFFNPSDQMALLAPSGSFAVNYGRTLAVLFCYLVFISGVGVTMGALFSMPVAAFCSVFVLLITNLDAYIHEMARETIFIETADPGMMLMVIERVFKAVFHALDFVVAPLQTPSVLSLVTTGRLVSWALVGSVFFIKVCLYGGLLALLGGWVLRRREIARAG